MQPLLALALPNGSEILFIFLIVLLLFGSKKLPELARGLGKSMQEFRRAREDFETELHTAKNDVTISEPANRQLHAAPVAGTTANAAALEQQVRELQERLREMQSQTPGAAVPASNSVEVPAVHAADPAVAAAPVVTPAQPAHAVPSERV